MPQPSTVGSLYCLKSATKTSGGDGETAPEVGNPISNVLTTASSSSRRTSTEKLQASSSKKVTPELGAGRPSPVGRDSVEPTIDCECGTGPSAATFHVAQLILRWGRPSDRRFAVAKLSQDRGPTTLLKYSSLHPIECLSTFAKATADKL